MVAEAGLFVALLAEIAIALQADFRERSPGLIRRPAERVVLLVGNHGARGVQLERGGPEVVAVLIADRLDRQRSGRDARIGGLRVDDGDALLVVHDVQRVPLDGVAGVLAIALERADVEALAQQRAAGGDRHLAHALTGVVVDVDGPLALMRGAVGVRSVDRLPHRDPQLVLERPLHRLELHHRADVAARVVGERLVERRRSADGGRAQAIPHLQRLDQARVGVRVGATPARIDGRRAGVRQLLQVANQVVGIRLGVAPHRRTVARMRQVDTRHVGVRRGGRRIRNAGSEAELLAPAGANQPVDRVVGVVGARLDPLIAEEHHVLQIGSVLDVRDVAGRIERVRQVLDDALIRGHALSLGGEPNEPEHQRIVGVGRRALVRVVDAQPLAFRVVVDLRDERRRDRRAADVDGDRLEKVRDVVGRTDHAALGTGRRDRAIERVVRRAPGEHVGRKGRRRRRPVGQRARVGDEAAPAAEEIALEVERVVLEDTR